MVTRRVLTFTIAGMVLAATGGCTGPGEIPIGTWSGTGTFVDYEAVAGETAAEERAQSRSYETELTISETRAFGRDALRFDILSKRGTLFNVPDEKTELHFVLLPLRTLDGGEVLYAGVEADNVGSGGAGGLPADSVARATSLRTPTGLVLHLDYGDPHKESTFVDTLHFLADRVVKTGTFTSDRNDGGKVARVWWTEQLRPAQ